MLGLVALIKHYMVACRCEQPLHPPCHCGRDSTPASQAAAARRQFALAPRLAGPGAESHGPAIMPAVETPKCAGQ